jgi:mono/diheme cytochrome c family protein/cytochrome c5
MHRKKFALALHSRDAAIGRSRLRFAFDRPRPSLLLLALGASIAGCARDESTPNAPRAADVLTASETRMNPATLAEGKKIFRFDTYGDETFWTDTLRMHEVIRTAVSPATALSVGLKVDADALPPEIVAGIKNKTVDLNSPATTVALLRLGAVVGVIGTVEGSTLTRVGITCALCHSTVDNSFAPGIGHRLDGWPNRDLDPGAIIALSPALTPAQRAVYNSWGPGKYDPRFNIDGINMPVVIPPAFGLRHVKREIYTGDGVVSYWNAYVGITQMHGHGHFVDSRIGVDINNPPDLISDKLEALRAYQFSIEAPEAPAGADKAAAQRGRAVFNGVAKCASCHLGDALTDVNANRLHTPAEVGQDAAYAQRSATKLYRTTPLRGLWHPPQLQGPYFHDGNAPTLDAAVAHYERLLGLTLTAQQRADLVAYLKTL